MTALKETSSPCLVSGTPTARNKMDPRHLMSVDREPRRGAARKRSFSLQGQRRGIMALVLHSATHLSLNSNARAQSEPNGQASVLAYTASRDRAEGYLSQAILGCGCHTMQCLQTDSGQGR